MELGVKCIEGARPGREMLREIMIFPMISRAKPSLPPAAPLPRLSFPFAGQECSFIYLMGERGTQQASIGKRASSVNFHLS